MIRPSLCLCIDPIFDFLDPQGVFAMHYPAEDLAPLYSLMDPLRSLLVQIKNDTAMKSILVTSQYYEGQFSNFKYLNSLCVTEKGRRSVLPVDLFHSIIVKTTSDIFDARNPTEQMMLLDILNAAKTGIFICGLTTTSCIKSTVHSLRAKGYGPITIARDVVAARSERANEAKTLLDLWSTQNIIVLDHWYNLWVE